MEQTQIRGDSALVGGREDAIDGEVPMKKTDQRDTTCTRRQVLRAIGAGGLAAAFPTIVPSSVLGKDAPSNRIAIAMIGMGRQALYANLKPFLQSGDSRVLAVCDVDRWRLEQARQAVDQHYQKQRLPRLCRLARGAGPQGYRCGHEFHAGPLARAHLAGGGPGGKARSCEKPLTLSVAEGRVLADAAKKHGVVFRTDSECRSDSYMHKTAELVRNGYLGRIKRIEVGVPTGDVAGGSSCFDAGPRGSGLRDVGGPGSDEALHGGPRSSASFLRLVPAGCDAGTRARAW